MAEKNFIPLERYRPYPDDEMLRRSNEFLQEIKLRRTVRQFSSQPVPLPVIENCLHAAGTAPSGANMQPWYFVVVSDPSLKSRIRLAAEAEERQFYGRRAPAEWLQALAPLGTDEHKPFLETAPYLIAIFAQSYGTHPDGHKIKHYYVQESVGIATGILITALHHAGLAVLTHTPSPMDFLNTILHRPENERPYLLLVVGHPAEDAQVPVLHKKALEEFVTFAASPD
jgi:iodotyrosine deiodinase